MAQIIPLAVIVATAGVNSDGTIASSRGVTGVVRNGAGDYSITLAVALPNSDFLPPLLTLVGGTPGTITYVTTSDTVIQVLTADEVAGVLTPADRSFGFILLRNEA